MEDETPREEKEIEGSEREAGTQSREEKITEHRAEEKMKERKTDRMKERKKRNTFFLKMSFFLFC